MGARKVYRVRFARTDLVATVLQALGCEERSKWSAQVSFYKPPQTQHQRGKARSAPTPTAGSGQREVCVVVLSDHRDSVFLVHSREKKVLESSPDMLRLLGEKLGAYAAPKTNYLVDGWRFLVGDYVVRCGRLALLPADESLCEVVDIEYRPVAGLEEAESMLQGFSNFLVEYIGVRGMALDPVEVPFKEYGLPDDDYTPQHAALPYAALCAAPR